MALKAALLATVGIIGLSTSANATTIITYVGTINAGSINNAGLFGGGSLDGLAFTATYTLTLPTPGADDYVTGNDASGSRIVYGDSPSSPLLGSLTINGYTINLGNDFGQVVLQNDNTRGDYLEHFVENASGSEFYNLIFSGSHNIIDSLDVTAPISYNVQAGDGSLGALNYSNANGSTRADFTNSSITVRTLVSPVPEPATWALMIGGFSLCGFSMRRRPRVRGDEAALA